MDKQLSLGQYLVMTVVILLLNNLTLFYFLGSSPDDSVIVQNREDIGIIQFETSVGDTNKPREAKNIEVLPNKPREAKNKEVLPNDDSERQDVEIADAEENSKVSFAVKQYMASNEFFEVLDVYRTQRQEKRREMQEQIASLNVSEVINAYFTATGQIDKNLILQELYGRDLSSVDSYLLKDLYHTDNVNDWMKENLIVAMFDRQDQESITLAREFVSKDTRERTRGEVWTRLFDEDRDYVIETLSGMSIDQLAKDAYAINALSNDSEALNLFYQEQLDNILDAENSKVFDNLNYLRVDMELSGSQQRRLGNSLQSERKSERRFAINFAPNIDDIDMLQDRYNEFITSEDRELFIFAMMSNTSTEAHRQLAQEIIKSSDDPRIRRLSSEG